MKKLLVILSLSAVLSLKSQVPSQASQPFLNSSDKALLEEILDVHLNYFLSSEAITASGLPLTAFKESDRGRHHWSNGTEWGYTMLAWMIAADRGKITIVDATSRMNTALDTITNLQNTPSQNVQDLFYQFYWVAFSNGTDRVPPVHDNLLEIPSIDNGFLYTSLFVLEGWAKLKNQTTVEAKARQIRERMNFRPFLQSNGNFLAHLLDANTGQPTSSKWDIYSDEGGAMAWIAYLSDSVSLEEYKNLIDSMSREPRSWNGIEVKEAAWFNAMFTWAVRTLAGFPVATFETGIENRFSSGSLVPNTQAHLDYGFNTLGIDYPGFSDASSQVGGAGGFYPPNLANDPLDTPSHSVPHAFFVPLISGPDLDSTTLSSLMGIIRDLKNDTSEVYHDGSTGHSPFGFEVTASANKNDNGFSGLDSRYVYETLNHSFIALSIHHALSIHDGTPTFYDYANQMPGYAQKVQDVLEFLYPVMDADITVPDDFPTIQQAIDAANSGDKIFVRAGTYQESILIDKSGLILEGEDQLSIIDGEPGMDVVQVNSATPDQIQIRGFKITNGSIGVHVLSNVSKLLIEDNEITRNLSITSGKGILLETNANAIIKDNRINNNGRCIESLGQNYVEVLNNGIAGCRGSFGGGVFLRGAQARVSGNTVSSCWDGAIHILLGSTASLYENTVTNNGAWATTSGVYIQDSTAVLWRNVIRQNTISNSGPTGGLHARNSDVWAYNNTFNSNTFPMNPASHNGSAMNILHSNFVARNNLITNNGSPGTPSAVFISGTGTHDFSYNNFWNNSTNSNTQGVVLGAGNLEVDPQYVDVVDFELMPRSLVIDAGDPNPSFNDPDGTRNDMGNHGGPFLLSLLAPIANAGPDRFVVNSVGNGAVDGLDYLIWQSQFGKTSEDSDFNPCADMNGNGIVDGADFTIWQDHFGGTSGGPADIDGCLDELVLLDGRNSFDLDGSIVNYKWEENISGSYQTLAEGASPTAQVLLQGLGAHTIRLTVFDEAGNFSSDTVEINVGDDMAAPATYEGPETNETPIVNFQDFSAWYNVNQSLRTASALNSPADINGDGAVNKADLIRIAEAWQSSPGQSNWNPRADIYGKTFLDDLSVFPNVQLDPNLGLENLEKEEGPIKVNAGVDFVVPMTHVAGDRFVASTKLSGSIHTENQYRPNSNQIHWMVSSCDSEDCSQVSIADPSRLDSPVSFGHSGKYKFWLLSWMENGLDANSVTVTVDHRGSDLNPGDPARQPPRDTISSGRSKIFLRKKFSSYRGEKGDIDFYLTRPKWVKVRIINRFGKVIRHLASGMFDQGLNVLQWDGLTDGGAAADSALYHVLCETDDGNARSRIVVSH